MMKDDLPPNTPAEIRLLVQMTSSYVEAAQTTMTLLEDARQTLQQRVDTLPLSNHASMILGTCWTKAAAANKALTETYSYILAHLDDMPVVCESARLLVGHSSRLHQAAYGLLEQVAIELEIRRPKNA